MQNFENDFGFSAILPLKMKVFSGMIAPSLAAQRKEPRHDLERKRGKRLLRDHARHFVLEGTMGEEELHRPPAVYGVQRQAGSAQ